MRQGGLPVIFQGIVTRFSGNGRRLGYPTANCKVKTKLQDGVYFGQAKMAGYTDHPALVFIGVPLTVGDTIRRLEVHLLDIPDNDYYGQQLEVELLHFWRANRHFDTVTGMIEIIKADEEAAREWFNKHPAKPVHP